MNKLSPTEWTLDKAGKHLGYTVDELLNLAEEGKIKLVVSTGLINIKHYYYEGDEHNYSEINLGTSFKSGYVSVPPMNIEQIWRSGETLLCELGEDEQGDQQCIIDNDTSQRPIYIPVKLSELRISSIEVDRIKNYNQSSQATPPAGYSTPLMEILFKVVAEYWADGKHETAPVRKIIIDKIQCKYGVKASEAEAIYLISRHPNKARQG